MNAQIIIKLQEANINPVGSLSALPQIIEDAISTVRMFGWNHWEAQTTMGRAAKQIVKDLS
jgi:hypothetical protein